MIDYVIDILMIGTTKLRSQLIKSQ